VGALGAGAAVETGSEAGTFAIEVSGSLWGRIGSLVRAGAGAGDAPVAGAAATVAAGATGATAVTGAEGAEKIQARVAAFATPTATTAHGHQRVFAKGTGAGCRVSIVGTVPMGRACSAFLRASRM
jgi:hypothetical protein